MLIMIRSLVPTYLPAAEEGNLENNLKLNPSKVKKDYFMDIAIYPSIFVSLSLSFFMLCAIKRKKLSKVGFRVFTILFMARWSPLS